jgi:hypothetical protein
MNIGAKIVDVADDFEGLVEVKSNQEWRDSARGAKFKAMLKRVGHSDGWPYCMSFCEGVWRVAYEEAGKEFGVIGKMLNPSVVSSYNNLKEAGISLRPAVPMEGAIFFMQNGSSGNGHAGIVTGFDGKFLSTIEANTSPNPKDAAQDRDGGAGTGGVWRKRRAYDFTKRSGLWLKGILNPL